MQDIDTIVRKLSDAQFERAAHLRYLNGYGQALRDVLEACKAERFIASASPAMKGPYPDASPWGGIGRMGSPLAYLIDPGSGSASDLVTRFWPQRETLDDIHLRGGEITPLYARHPAKPVAYLHECKDAAKDRHRELDFHSITDADRAHGWTQTPLYSGSASQ